MHRSPKFILTKIIATVGPACSDVLTLQKMIESGVRIFRINFSHGSLEEYETHFDNIRKAAHESHIPVGIMGDLSGPKIRIGKVIDEGVNLEKGKKVKFIREEVVTGENPDEILFSTNYDKLIDDVKNGQSLLLDDGALKLRCVNKDSRNNFIECVVENGGIITSNKGLNLPDSELSLPALTEKDLKCAEFAAKKGFDFLALSFVKTAADVTELINFLEKIGARPGQSDFKLDENRFVIHNESGNFMPVISKIEKPQAVKNLEAILEVTDGVMVARGDLGVEMDLAEVSVIQKIIIDKCYDYGIPVIVATQMIQSMINSPVPTRAEVSDVANAILDGADAVMLSGETSIGEYPVETVQMMNRIAKRTNEYYKIKEFSKEPPQKLQESKLLTPALANGVKTLVKDTDAKLIVVWTHTDGMPVYLSKHHLKIPIMACSASREVLQRMSLLYGIRPIYMAKPNSDKNFIDSVDEFLSYRRWVNIGDPIIVIMGEPFDHRGISNRIQIHYVGD